MKKRRALRLYELASQRDFLVLEDKVYEDKDGDGRIGWGDEAEPQALGSTHAVLLEAAAFFLANYDPRMPSALSADGAIRSGAVLNAVEQREFEEDARGAPCRRSLLEQHLSFFDPMGTGTIGFLDNYCAWRALGFGRLKSLVQTAATSLIFGRKDGGAIVIRNIGQNRPAGPTGIYDSRGEIDASKWEQVRQAWDQVADEEGAVSQEQCRQLLADFVTLGKVPGRQFETLYAVCGRMNGSPTITLDQLRWLYDGSLLWRVLPGGGSVPSVVVEDGAGNSLR